MSCEMTLVKKAKQELIVSLQFERRTLLYLINDRSILSEYKEKGWDMSEEGFVESYEADIRRNEEQLVKDVYART